MIPAYPDLFRLMIFMEKKDGKVVRIIRMAAGVQKCEFTKLFFFRIVRVIVFL